MALAVSRWLLSVDARVQSPGNLTFVSGKAAPEQLFLQFFSANHQFTTALYAPIAAS
jgi:hypothetical protein